MRLPRFEYARPTSVAAAVELLAQAGGKAKILAGGTDLIPNLKRRSIAADLLISIKEIHNLYEIAEQSDGGALIRAGVSLRQVKELSKWQAVAQAASRAAAAELRNIGTIGGNILVDNRCWYYNRSREWWRGKDLCYKRGGNKCYAFPTGKECRAAASSDLATALIAMGAKVEVTSTSGASLLPIQELYQANGACPHTISGEKMVTGIYIPGLPLGSGTSFNKLAKRQTMDFALVNAAARITVEADGITCAAASAVVSGSTVLPTILPIDRLLGQEITPALLEETATEAVKKIGFVTHAGALDVPVSYRRQSAKVLLRNCLEQAWQQARSEVTL